MFNKKQNRREGMAIIIVLIFSVLLLVLFASMSFQHRSVAGRNKLNLRDQQAYFAARAAMQHFLLKARLFPTELYDAVEFMQGKNPYFDFSEFPFRTDDNKPAFQELPSYSGVYKRIIPAESDASGRVKFFYIPLKMAGSEPEAMLRLASFYNPNYRYLAPGLAPGALPEKYISPDNSKNKDYSPGKFLSYFIRDCTNDLVDGQILQPMLKTEKMAGMETEQSWGINDEGYPYTMNYSIKAIEIKAIQGLRRYNEEAIEIQCRGSVIDFQDQPASKELQQIRKITRTGRHLTD
ncbi:MAG TPA: hypothetical protein PLK28_00475 [Candidatus Rifleibacterium sp.]|jgi:hypothetical protein|nr:hypothetical protein [Candidatus Rifleibacterium sp.]HPW59852.1 hypothetical protein [Candidatus Rifleibacterium sp.]